MKTPVAQRKEIRRSLAYIADNFQRPMTLDELAAAAGMRKSAFARLFREQVGVPPHQYIVQLRLEHARALLASGKPCGQTASQVGFSDQSHLNRWFRRAYGVTPGEYQRTLAA